VSIEPTVIRPKETILEANFTAPFNGAAAITPSNTLLVTPGKAFMINCTVAGDVKVGFVDGSTLTITVAIGTLILPWAVQQVFVTGTTATATYANLNF
jgi:ethanolamine utilization microcompartment shell protein EutS